MAKHDPATTKQINLLRNILRDDASDFDAVWRPIIIDVTKAAAPGFGASAATYEGWTDWIARKAPKLNRGEASDIIDRVKSARTEAAAQ